MLQKNDPCYSYMIRYYITVLYNTDASSILLLQLVELDELE